ncbi:MAG: UDP-4-amino-4,6-dideoxy-N-acetyl-beta-L-altrosamine transaminase [Clostridium sp.]|nr:UDP-4-amino-4,6-dideoxy-N-acetyl-beta-L-altrosamine transaminase [Clostridium sp.]MCM1458770.1 UDP-4-amino-4,6-dideoxy-N-acetyl-beta-L-altrosamine transaminase [Bacteroides sp.]
MYIPYGRQSIDENDIQAVVEVLRSDYLTTGPKVGEFEKRVADYVGAKYAVAVNSGTAALHIACLAAGIKEGDEVITSPITFAASSNCVLYCGGTPVFADIDECTYNISPAEIEKAITGRTKAIIPVHYTGQPCDMDAIMDIAGKHNLLVIEDAAHALGASYKGRKVGSMADMTCFSFHPVKPITTGEGGMVVTNNEELYKRLILFRSHGITRDEAMMTEQQGDWYYQQLELGYNYRITDISCALGLSQMDKLDGFLEKRKAIANRYHEAFKDVDEIKIPMQLSGCESGWHLYMIQVKADCRKKIFDSLRTSGIGVNVHYIPVYKHPYYQRNGYADVCCKNGEAFYQRAISLPIFPLLTVWQQDYVIEQVLRLVKESML